MKKATVLLLVAFGSVFGQLTHFGLENQKVTSLALSQTYSSSEFIIAGTDSGGIFMRNFSGEDTSWINQYFYDRSVTSVFVQRQGIGPIDYSRIFVGVKPNTIDSTLIYSYDSPVQSYWSKRDSGLSNAEVNRISSFAGFNYSGHEPPLPVFCCDDNSHIYVLRNTIWEKSWSWLEGLSVISQLYSNDSTVFACGTFNGFIPAPIVLKSEDYGTTWNEYPPGFFNSGACSITASPDDSDTIYVALNNTIIKSTDGGTNWDSTSIHLENTIINSLLINPLNHVQIFAGGKKFNNTFILYRSDNGGSTWSQVQYFGNCNCIMAGINCMTGRVNNNEFEIYIGTEGDGVYKYTPDITGTDLNPETEIPPRISLLQNYPNPFNPTTTIEYQVSTYSFVTLIVYDILGKKVSILVNDYKTPGHYKELFKANNLSSGIYYCVLKSGNYILTRKMLLIK